MTEEATQKPITLDDVRQAERVLREADRTLVLAARQWAARNPRPTKTSDRTLRAAVVARDMAAVALQTVERARA